MIEVELSENVQLFLLVIIEYLLSLLTIKEDNSPLRESISLHVCI